MKSFKHFKEDSDSDDRGSESLSKLKSRRELAKQRSFDSLRKFRERSAENESIRKKKQGKKKDD
tara:strand:+ start:224 stop:415 length:192 start_codon:yes stop_codon:yes gene_type:complete